MALDKIVGIATTVLSKRGYEPSAKDNTYTWANENRTPVTTITLSPSKTDERLLEFCVTSKGGQYSFEQRYATCDKRLIGDATIAWLIGNVADFVEKLHTEEKIEVQETLPKQHKKAS